MEGTLVRVPSIALSQSYTHQGLVRWSTAQQHGAEVIRKLAAVGWPASVLMNVNFPDVPHDHVKGIAVCKQGKRDFSDLLVDERVDARGQTYYWLGFTRRKGTPPAGTDLAMVAAGHIAVTPLQLDLTDAGTMRSLRRALG